MNLIVFLQLPQTTAGNRRLPFRAVHLNVHAHHVVGQYAADNRLHIRHLPQFTIHLHDQLHRQFVGAVLTVLRPDATASSGHR